MDQSATPDTNGLAISRLNDTTATSSLPIDDDRFALGTYAAIGPSVLDEKTGQIYPFGAWANAQNAISTMRRYPDSHPYAPISYPRVRFFTECEPTVEGARS